MYERRSNEFKIARQAFLQIGDLGRVESDKLAPIRICFIRWLDKYLAGRFVRLCSKEEPVRWLFIRAVSRFMPRYKERLRRRFDIRRS